MIVSQPQKLPNQQQVKDALLRVGHDRYFKAIMELSEVSTEFFTKHLPPALLAQLNLKTLKLEKDSFIRDSLKRKEADVLFSVQKTNGISGYIHLVFEHLSSQQADLPFRMHQYAMDIMDAHRRKHKTKKLPFVYPIVLYTGERPYTQSLDFFDAFAEEDRELVREYMFQSLNLIDLTHIADETIKQEYDWLQLAAFLAKAIHHPNVEQQLPDIMKIARTIRQRDAWIYVVLSIAYLFSKCTIDDQVSYNRLIDDVYLAPEEGEFMKTIAEHLRQEGIQAGIALGEKKGLEEGLSQGLSQGLSKGKAEGKKELVQQMLLQGILPNTIAQMTGLSIQEIHSYMQ